MAEATRQEEQHGPPEELPFTATILCLGIAGTGKTATIHSLLGRPQPSNFAEGTKKVVLPSKHLKSFNEGLANPRLPVRLADNCLEFGEYRHCHTALLAKLSS